MKTRPYRMTERRRQVDATRARIMAATLDLWVEVPYDVMTLDAIAERAGTTRQTVLRQFGSKDDLAMAAWEWRGGQIAARHQPPTLDRDEALDQLVARYEEFGDANARTGDLEGRFAFADEALARGRRRHREWIELVFAAQLERLDDEQRRRVVDGLYAATDVMVWKLLRRDFGRSQADTRGVIGDLVAGVLATTDAPSNPEVER